MSKLKGHQTALESRLELWRKDAILQLLKEGETIQNGLTHVEENLCLK